MTDAQGHTRIYLFGELLPALCTAAVSHNFRYAARLYAQNPNSPPHPIPGHSVNAAGL